MNMYFLWFSAIFITFLLVFTVGYELYLLLVKKQDRGFWRGCLSLFSMWFFGMYVQISYDMIQNQNFLRSIENPAIGQINKNSLREMFPDVSNGFSCKIDGTEKSKQCIFILEAESNEDLDFLTVVSNEEQTIIRAGEWPFATTMSFPPRH
jgi:hypothetical protein